MRAVALLQNPGEDHPKAQTDEGNINTAMISRIGN